MGGCVSRRSAKAQGGLVVPNGQGGGTYRSGPFSHLPQEQLPCDDRPGSSGMPASHASAALTVRRRTAPMTWHSLLCPLSSDVGLPTQSDGLVLGLASVLTISPLQIKP
jgi:hypothetical protein